MNSCTLKNSLLEENWVKVEIRKLKTFLELNEKNISNTMGHMEAVLKEKSIALSAYIKKLET